MRGRAMDAIERLIRRLARIGLGLSAAALLASLATIVYAVVRRYVFNAPVAWTDELVGYLLVASVMLATADALFGGEHISVDIVTEKLAPRGKRVAFLFGLAAVAATAVLLIVEGVGMVRFSNMVGLRSNGDLALPLWIPQALVPIGALLLLLAALAAFVDAWRGKAVPPERVTPAQGIE
ncbi:MAG TPA: TRAP transporter small permease [Casimicrobiaceae bacterium]|nr:TRAP transporter small permease [Casimicrobiaceae bacterium]